MSISTSPKLLNHWPALLLAVLPGALAIALFFFVYLPLTQQHAAEIRADDLALSKAVMVDSNLQQLANHLDGLARLPKLRLAMRDSDTAALEKMTDDFSLEFTHLYRLALFPLGELGVANLGLHGEKLQNNIEKDILRRAAEHESVLLDTYLLEGQRVFSLARPVYAGDRSIGAILLTLNAEWLASQIDDQRGEVTGDARVGSTELIYQIASAAPLSIASSHAGLESNNKLITGEAILLANQNIKVKFHLAPVGQSLAIESIVLLAAIVASIIASLIALLMVFTRGQKHLRSDIELLDRYVRDSAERDVTEPTFIHGHFAAVTETLAGTLATAQRSRAVAPESKPAVAETPEETQIWANPQLAGGIIVDDDDDSVNETEAVLATEFPRHIFRAYDIRGHAENELSDEVIHNIGLAFGTTALRGGQDRLVVGRDGRLSSERIHTALIQGLLAAGCDVIDIGLVATPMLYFAVESLMTQAGVMITGSHNGAEVNGLKLVLNGQALAGPQIAALAEQIQSRDFEAGQGLLSSQDIADGYIDRIAEDVVVASSVKVVLDCGNGAASEIAPLLYASLGCEVVPLFAEIDGSFPNHSPDPGVAGNLTALIDEIKNHQADLGLAFDGDADRMVAVTASGRIVNADQMLMLFAKDVLTRNPGADVVYDIKCSRHLNQVIANQGGRPVMWKSGHSLIKQKMHETGALLGGEFTGHYFFKERWYGFDDGLYSGTRLIELLTLEGASLDAVIDELPSSFSTPEIHLAVDESEKFTIIEALQNSIDAGDGQLTTMDGVRIDYAEGWGLIRASNTSACLSMRFEANSEEALKTIQARFKEALSAIAPALAEF